MGTPQDPGAVFNMLLAGNNQLFSEIAAQFPDGAATAFTVGVGLAMLVGQCALSAYFSFVATSGPWHAMPGFTAHQLIYCERRTCPAAPTTHAAHTLPMLVATSSFFSLTPRRPPSVRALFVLPLL